MPASIAVSYLKEEQTLIEDVNGLRVTEAYLVTGLTPGRIALYEATQAPGVPRYGEAHAISNLLCSIIDPRPFAKTSNTEAKVICTFLPPDFSNTVTPIIRFHGTTREVQTNFDSEGQPIIVRYTDYDSDGAPVFPEQIGVVRGTKAMGYLTFEFISASDPTYLLAYLNKLNDSAWRGGATYTWLCADVQIDKEIYRAGWHVEIGFLYDEETHIHTAAYRLLGGIIPKNIDPVPLPKSGSFGNGWNNVLTNLTADFNTLDLPAAF